MPTHCYVCGCAEVLHFNKVKYKDMFSGHIVECHPRTCHQHTPMSDENYAWMRLHRTINSLLKKRTIDDVIRILARSPHLEKRMKKHFIPLVSNLKPKVEWDNTLVPSRNLTVLPKFVESVRSASVHTYGLDPDDEDSIDPRFPRRQTVASHLPTLAIPIRQVDRHTCV